VATTPPLPNTCSCKMAQQAGGIPPPPPPTAVVAPLLLQCQKRCPCHRAAGSTSSCLATTHLHTLRPLLLTLLLLLPLLLLSQHNQLQEGKTTGCPPTPPPHTCTPSPPPCCCCAKSCGMLLLLLLLLCQQQQEAKAGCCCGPSCAPCLHSVLPEPVWGKPGGGGRVQRNNCEDGAGGCVATIRGLSINGPVGFLYLAKGR